MKQVFPRFCNPIKPKEPTPELPFMDVELAKTTLESRFPLTPLLIRDPQQDGATILDCCTARSSFFASFLHLIESDNPYTCNSKSICRQKRKEVAKKLGPTYMNVTDGQKSFLFTSVKPLFLRWKELRSQGKRIIISSILRDNSGR